MSNTAYAKGFGFGMAFDAPTLGNAEENIIGQYTHGEISKQEAIAKLSARPGYTSEKAEQVVSRFTPLSMDGFFSEALKGKYTPDILAKADKVLQDHQSGRMGEGAMLSSLKKLGLSKKDIDTLY